MKIPYYTRQRPKRMANALFAVHPDLAHGKGNYTAIRRGFAVYYVFAVRLFHSLP
jgi:hypothetical protein